MSGGIYTKRTCTNTNVRIVYTNFVLPVITYNLILITCYLNFQANPN